ncbi:MAG TPA: formyltransferase family protein [Candidatus Baltobacteraceae bacterium]|nr:formyltransferase family protein [Candidatus Baltobacteraceae bacterium]
MSFPLVNLAVDLQQPQFEASALQQAIRSIERAGYSVEAGARGSDAFLAWIDEEFGGAWSSEAFAGSSVIVKKDERFAGFATYGAHGMRYSWLRGLGREPHVGIFGPFGVAGTDRGSPIGPQLLIAALASLAQQGYSRALIPAVGHEKLAAYYQRHSGAYIAETFDKAQWKGRAYRTVVLASGNGTNFQAVIDAAAANQLPLDIRRLISNKADAFALTRARRADIPAMCLEWERQAMSREGYDDALADIVQLEQPDLVLLLGWMHLLPERFILANPNTINIHPAFLPLDPLRDDVGYPDASVTPAFRGPRAIDDALAWGSRWVGASAHHISPDMDRGPVLVRAPLQVRRGETRDAVLERLHPLEHTVLTRAIMRWVYER